MRPGGPWTMLMRPCGLLTRVLLWYCFVKSGVFTASRRCLASPSAAAPRLIFPPDLASLYWETRESRILTKGWVAGNVPATGARHGGHTEAPWVAPAIGNMATPTSSHIPHAIKQFCKPASEEMTAEPELQTLAQRTAPPNGDFNLNRRSV